MRPQKWSWGMFYGNLDQKSSPEPTLTYINISPEPLFSFLGGAGTFPAGSRWVYKPICVALCVPLMPVAQVCLVLSVRENGSDWQLTQIGLKRSDLSRTVDRINQMEKNYQVNFVTLPSYSRFCIFLYSLNLYEVCLVLSNAKFSFGPGEPLLYRTLDFANRANT